MIWQKKVIENREKSKITKHLNFLFVFVKERQFTDLTNSKLISELLSSVKVSFLVFQCNMSMTYSDKQNNSFCTCTIAKFSE